MSFLNFLEDCFSFKYEQLFVHKFSLVFEYIVIYNQIKLAVGALGVVDFFFGNDEFQVYLDYVNKKIPLYFPIISQSLVELMSTSILLDKNPFYTWT